MKVVKSYGPHVPFVPTRSSIAEKMLEIAGLKKGEILYDLGSGDGVILRMAAEKFGAYAYGIEIKGDLVEKSREEAKMIGLGSRIKVVHDNFLEPRFWYHLVKKRTRYLIRHADVVTLYLNDKMNEVLKPRLEKELIKGARIVCRGWGMPWWKNLYGKDDLYLYQVGISF